jgi:hypothetical protein
MYTYTYIYMYIYTCIYQHMKPLKLHQVLHTAKLHCGAQSVIAAVIVVWMMVYSVSLSVCVWSYHVRITGMQYYH